MPSWGLGRGEPSQYAVLTPDHVAAPASAQVPAPAPSVAPAWSARLSTRPAAPLAPGSGGPESVVAATPQSPLPPPPRPPPATSGPGGRGVGDLYPVGRLSSGVASHALSWVPVPHLALCAQASRNLARAVADERVWACKWAAAQWAHVQGVQDPPEVERWEEELRLRAQHDHRPLRTTTGLSSAAASASAVSPVSPMQGQGPGPGQAKAQGQGFVDDDDFGQFTSAEPEWGDFASAPINNNNSSNSNNNSTSTHLAVAPTPGKALAGRGGSLAHGLASVTLASKAQSAHHAPDQVLASSETGTADAATQDGSTVFSFAAEAAASNKPVPRISHTLAAAALLARRKQVLPIVRALKDDGMPADLVQGEDEGDAASSGALSHPLLVGLDVATQAVLLGNVARLLAYPVLILPEKDAHEVWPKLLRIARHLAQQALLPSFIAADARRSDAVRAGEVAHNAQVTRRAVLRAEEDMRATARALWSLGSALEQGDPVDVSAQNGFPDPSVAKTSNEPFVIDSDDDDTASMAISAAAHFLESRPLFGTHLNAPLRSHDPLSNVVQGADAAVMKRQADVKLDFGPMDAFMASVAKHVESDGGLAARVFPKALDVVLALADKAAEDVVMVYIKPLLARASELDDTWTTRHPIAGDSSASGVERPRGSDGLSPPGVYPRAFAAAYTQSLTLAVAARTVQGPGKDLRTLQRCEEVVHRMWSPLVPGYLAQERSWADAAMRAPCAIWARTLTRRLVDAQPEGEVSPPGAASAKRSALAAARSALVKPVVLVPRAAASAWSGLLWNQSSEPAVDTEAEASGDKVSGLTDAEQAADDGEEGAQQRARDEAAREILPDEAGWGGGSSEPDEKKAVGPHDSSELMSGSVSTGKTGDKSRLSMASLLDLDTVVEIIQAHRQSLRRMEAFTYFEGQVGEQARREREQLALQFFTLLDKEHVQPAFQRAQDQVGHWSPSLSVDNSDLSKSKMLHTAQAADYVAPVVQFTALTHVADALLQLVQVYVDTELLRPVGPEARAAQEESMKTGAKIERGRAAAAAAADFLHPVVREQARFQRAVDARVALGLNLGVDVLMRQAEYLLSTLQLKTDFDPPPADGKPPDLAVSTHACEVVTACLGVHCRVLRDVVERETRDVFFREIGTRLHGLLIRHLKRQAISTRGGWQVIADMNAYHTLVMQHVRLPDLGRLFDGLKMLAHLFVVEGARELSALVKDGRLAADGAAGSPEEVAELLQARKDYRIIAPAIDKELYGFKVREDCIIQ